MSRINRLPSGLQEFLGNTSQGVNPSELSNVVSPTFDISDFWKVQKQDEIRIVTSMTAVYQSAFFQIPQSELWMLIGVSAGVNILTTESAQLVVQIAEPAAISRTIIASSPYRTAGATSETIVAHASMPPGYMVPSGAKIYVTANMMNVAAARGGELIMRFVRFLV